MPAIKSFEMTVDALNESETFSERDVITGKVTLVLLKETTVTHLFIKAKGDAKVHWTRRRGDRTYNYSADKRFFKLKDFLIPEQPKDTVLPHGVHVYKFSLRIPPGEFPSSFRGTHGKIVYKLEVSLSRSWRMDRTLEKEIRFVSKSIPAFQNVQSMMMQQGGSTSKEMGLFSKGRVHMEATIDRKAYAPGETVTVVANINNSSSSEMSPKFSLKQDIVYRASGDTNYENNVIMKLLDSPIKAQTQKQVKCTMKLPPDLVLSIQNLDIISVEYRLKVKLDISFASDPEIIFPLFICHPDLLSASNPGVAAQPALAGAVGGPSNSDFPPYAVPMGPYPASPNSGGYRYPGARSYSPSHGSLNYPPTSIFPDQPASMGASYNNVLPQRNSPYGFQSLSSTTLHPPPVAPAFSPTPSAPQLQPLPQSASLPTSSFSMPPAAPAYNLLPSAPAMNTDFLSQSDEAPPAYSLLFPSSESDQSGAN